jgi:hypothetical protein
VVGVLLRVGMGEFAISMGMGMDVGDLPLLQKDSPIGHPIDLMGCLEDKIHVVRDENVRDINFIEDVYNPLRRFRIEARGRLIQEQDPGFHGKDGGKGDQFSPPDSLWVIRSSNPFSLRPYPCINTFFFMLISHHMIISQGKNEKNGLIPPD